MKQRFDVFLLTNPEVNITSSLKKIKSIGFFIIEENIELALVNDSYMFHHDNLHKLTNFYAFWILNTIATSKMLNKNL